MKQRNRNPGPEERKQMYNQTISPGPLRPMIRNSSPRCSMQSAKMTNSTIESCGTKYVLPPFLVYTGNRTTDQTQTQPIPLDEFLNLAIILGFPIRGLQSRVTRFLDEEVSPYPTITERNFKPSPGMCRQFTSGPRKRKQSLTSHPHGNKGGPGLGLNELCPDDPSHFISFNTVFFIILYILALRARRRARTT